MKHIIKRSKGFNYENKINSGKHFVLEHEGKKRKTEKNLK